MPQIQAEMDEYEDYVIGRYKTANKIKSKSKALKAIIQIFGKQKKYVMGD